MIADSIRVRRISRSLVAVAVAFLACCSDEDEFGDAVCRAAERTVVFRGRVDYETSSPAFVLTGEPAYVGLLRDYGYSPEALFSRVGSIIIHPAGSEPGDERGDGYGFDVEGQYRQIGLPSGVYQAYSGSGQEVDIVECPSR